MDNKIKEAVRTLIEALNSDEGYRISWKANIAMTFQDEFFRQANECKNFTKYIFTEGGLHNIANNAADNFLNLLCAETKTEE